MIQYAPDAGHLWCDTPSERGVPATQERETAPTAQFLDFTRPHRIVWNGASLGDIGLEPEHR